MRSVTTTAAALRLVDELSPDIVAFDLCSSVSGERDLMTELRAKNHRPMPIGIAISAGGSGQSAEAMKAGYHSFLVKPLTLESTSTALATANRLLLRRSARSTKTREKKR
ncbi:MAG TPA: hypothetical protein VF407_10465 [Polyangiaceae bacterium]